MSYILTTCLQQFKSGPVFIGSYLKGQLYCIPILSLVLILVNVTYFKRKFAYSDPFSSHLFFPELPLHLVLLWILLIVYKQ